MVNHYGWNLSDIEDVYVFEREIYVTLLNTYIEEKNKAAGKGSKDNDYQAYIRSFQEAEAKAKQGIRQNASAGSNQAHTSPNRKGPVA